MNNPDLGKVGKHFSSEYQPENTGRKKNRFKQIQNDFELSLDDMKQVINDILSMTDIERQDVIDSDTEPGYRKAIASAVKGCIKSSNWTQINYMFDRLFGKAVEAHRLVNKDNEDIPLTIKTEEENRIKEEYGELLNDQDKFIENEK